ncbi:uncharacterized protein LAJ45_01185 [Morchella importuna]|uniref:uncharacterized protein n=1 Tax=Morchella importuna TaxID=1174673 RepID=UPI001E8D81A9|nr:uncharacterized protein LAJ45_01185 [Morchella importuna]KAH8154656.1 hypothetical protein LAJ45_01185 [Morchella importuna]
MSYLGLVLNTCSGSGSDVADSEPAALEPERKRGKAWLAWEDRALAKQVLADDPILNRPGGKKEDCWREVALNLSRKMNMNRSGSCKNRMDLLVGLHRTHDQNRRPAQLRKWIFMSAT